MPLTFRKTLLVTFLLGVVSMLSTCGGGGISNSGGSGGGFGLGTPTINRLSPTGASAGGGDFVLSVYGTNLSADSSVVCWNGQDRPTGLNCVGVGCLSQAAHVDAMISSADIAAEGTAHITVHNPGTAASNAMTFTIGKSAPPPPCSTCIDEIIPNEVGAGGPAFILTVNGKGFFSGMTVMWDNTANPTSNFQRPTTFISYNQLTAAIPASDIQTPGTAYVYVMDISGVTSTKVLFTIQ